MRDLRRALGAATGQAKQAARATESTSVAFDLDEEEHLASGSYAKELLEAAE